MSQQEHVYYRDPDIVEIDTTVIAVRREANATYIAVKQNLMRAGGGGEPRDIGLVELAANDNFEVLSVFKDQGKTWMECGSDVRLINNGDFITVKVDADHRMRRRKLHTGVHICLRAAYDYFSNVVVDVADINDEATAATIVARVNQPVKDEDVWQVDRNMRSIVQLGHPVKSVKAKSIEAADELHGHLLRVSDRYAFKGRVRLIAIEGIDVNPCSGLHASTSDIGPYSMERISGVEAAEVFAVRIQLLPCWAYWY